MFSITRRRRLNKSEEGDRRGAARVVVGELEAEEKGFESI